MAEKILQDKQLVVRHSLLELIEHWAIALSGLTLIVSGFFEMPIANRYYFTSIPGFSWSGNFFVSLNIHYIASIIFVSTALFHVVYHNILGERGLLPKGGDLKTSAIVIKSFFGNGEEPPFHKYLPEQRLAYVGMAFIIAMLILSGLVKTYKNIYAPDMSYTVVLTATWIHNIFFLLFVLSFFAHMAAIILKPNWPMIRAIFTGSVRLDYARHRHPLWMAELEGIKESPAAVNENAMAPQPEIENTEPIGAVTEPEDTPNSVKGIQESDRTLDESEAAKEDDLNEAEKTLN